MNRNHLLLTLTGSLGQIHPTGSSQFHIASHHWTSRKLVFTSPRLHTVSCITHNTFGKPLLENVFRQWQTQLSATWADKVRDRQALTFALVHPEPEDISVGVLAQIIVTEGAVADSRSNVISVYDSDPDMERSPYTLAMVLPRRLNLAGLLSVLHLQAECPPHALENLCSLWIGRIPIGSNHEVNVFMRNAFLSRGYDWMFHTCLPLTMHSSAGSCNEPFEVKSLTGHLNPTLSMCLQPQLTFPVTAVVLHRLWTTDRAGSQSLNDIFNVATNESHQITTQY